MAEKDWKNQLTQILERLSALEEKYDGMGQDMLSYLDGLYYSNGLTYWEYIHLDSLLGLQVPRTSFKDEMIFITYHQITELKFKLIKLEIDALTQHRGEDSEYLEAKNWHKRIKRVINYFKHLCNSFDIMLTMDREEMRKFRMALLPASGFQSVQFRHIEIMSTRLFNLITGIDPNPADQSIPAVYPEIYWKKGGIDLETKKKTITLRQFEKKYDEDLMDMIEKYEDRNLEYLFNNASEEIKSDQTIIDLLKEFDQYINIYWKLSHLAAASKHLVAQGKNIDATGGTNWKSFLPPKFQKIIFYPDLWTPEEKENWGKAGVVKYFQQAISGSWMK